MSRGGNELRERIEALLHECDGITFEFWRRSRHPAVTIRGPAGKRTVTYAGSPANRHTLQNVLRNVRHAVRAVTEGDAIGAPAYGPAATGSDGSK